MPYQQHNAPALPLRILLADDDMDDRNFFEKALRGFSIPTQLETVDNGEKLMAYLFENSEKLPDVLFLDLNMPRKNGLECLAAIKEDKKLNQIPVIIYSTSIQEDVANQLYKYGAYYYVRKTELAKFKVIFLYVLTLLEEKKLLRPARAEFVISLRDTHS